MRNLKEIPVVVVVVVTDFSFDKPRNNPTPSKSTQFHVTQNVSSFILNIIKVYSQRIKYFTLLQKEKLPIKLYIPLDNKHCEITPF